MSRIQSWVPEDSAWETIKAPPALLRSRLHLKQSLPHPELLTESLVLDKHHQELLLTTSCADGAQRETSAVTDGARGSGGGRDSGLHYYLTSRDGRGDETEIAWNGLGWVNTLQTRSWAELMQFLYHDSWLRQHLRTFLEWETVRQFFPRSTQHIFVSDIPGNFLLFK